MALNGLRIIEVYDRITIALRERMMNVIRAAIFHLVLWVAENGGSRLDL